MNLIRLKVNNQVNPCIDKAPYFSWVIISDKKNVMQKSYQITVSCGDEVFWDSGIVESDKSTFVCYEGKTLEDLKCYTWTVTVIDNYDDSVGMSASFQTGFINKEWQAKWVSSPFKMKKTKKGNGGQNCAEYFRRGFNVTSQIKCASVYATCRGAYELSVNGKRPDDRILAPEFTLYSKYLCYQWYDITQLVKLGENVLGMLVGDGWYNSKNFKDPDKGIKKEHAVLFQIKLDYEDGHSEMVCSDDKIMVYESPVRSADLFAGELYDARKELEGWNDFGRDFNEWKCGIIKGYGFKNLYAQYGEPVRPVMEVKPVGMFISPKGETIIDFGQNMAGFVRMHVNLPENQEISIEYFEVLDKDGNYFNSIAMAEARGYLQIDRFISNGKEADYTPHFTYHGFRYIKIECNSKVKMNDFIAIAVATDSENIGEFETSNSTINRLYENTRWSQRSNMVSIPTDCPSREKGGWTGDIQIYARTALSNENVTPFLTRWLYNVMCNQMDNGAIPNVVPLVGIYATLEKLNRIFYGNHAPVGEAGWGDAICIIPWDMYQMTGNRLILVETYESQKKWCDYIISEAKNKRGKQKLPKEFDQYLWNTGHQYGEWLIPSQTMNGEDLSSKWKVNTAAYCAPIFGYNSCNTVSKVAALLGDKESAVYYGNIAEKMKRAIQQSVIEEDGKMPLDFMGAYVLAIAFDVASDRQKPLIAEHLIRKIKENGYCLDTGFIPTPYLLDALCKIGRVDLAYQLLLQDKCPSWLYEVRRGATSIWENYVAYKEDGNPVQTSFNHYAFGSIDDWMFRKLCGIDSLKPGYKQILIKPELGGGFISAKRSYVSEYGKISVDWMLKDSRFNLKVEVPCNTSAKIVLPSGITHLVGSGKYEFSDVII